MKGFIKTKDSKDNIRLINIKFIEEIKNDGNFLSLYTRTGFSILFESKNAFERSQEFLNRMTDRIFLVLSDCEYDNVFIDIEVIKNDITKELKEERENDD